MELPTSNFYLTSVGFAQFSLGYDQNGSSPQHNHLTSMVKFPASTLSRHFTYGKSPFFLKRAKSSINIRCPKIQPWLVYFPAIFYGINRPFLDQISGQTPPISGLLRSSSEHSVLTNKNLLLKNPKGNSKK